MRSVGSRIDGLSAGRKSLRIVFVCDVLLEERVLSTLVLEDLSNEEIAWAKR